MFSNFFYFSKMAKNVFWPALSEKASYQSKMLDLGSQNSLLQHAVCPNFWYFSDFLNTVRLLYVYTQYLSCLPSWWLLHSSWRGQYYSRQDSKQKIQTYKCVQFCKIVMNQGRILYDEANPDLDRSRYDPVTTPNQPT